MLNSSMQKAINIDMTRLKRIDIDKSAVLNDKQKALLKKQWGNDILNYVLNNDPRADILFNAKDDYACIISSVCFDDVDYCYCDTSDIIYNTIIDNDYDFEKVAKMFMTEPDNDADCMWSYILNRDYDKIFYDFKDIDVESLLYTKEK